ncbi:glycosyltransferase family 4 protein [Bdellovibrio svalbardensis]|uniref:Glycosyltransferase n=1 Tax=Bdellovibrio svalbardensis TaxID=2972972 RepID=A0ABT6DMH4_9BACT|nr:glycosyltransferase [Bdellovibrio svalbardensis]MDG0818063.1 glycosyltransferase [Bdellovibrio svalbardensis]
MKSIHHPEASGDREIARGLFEYLQEQGHQVEILSEFQTPFFFQTGRGWWSFLRSFPKAFWKALTFQPDIFFTYHLYYKAPDPLGLILSTFFRKRYYVFEGMFSEKPRSLTGFKVGYYLTKWSLQRANCVYTDKTDDIEGLLKVLPASRVCYIPPSLNLSVFTDPGKKTSTPQSIQISCISMLRPGRKVDGVKFLIEAIAELQQEMASQQLNFNLKIAGDGPSFEEVKHYAESLLKSRVQLCGALGKEKILELLRSSDLFAFPGIDESFGLVYLEAQSQRLPVIAFKNGGVPDAVEDQVSGVLTPLMEKSAYKKALLELIQNNHLREKMGQQGRLRIEKKFNRQINYKKMDLEK